MNSPIISTHTLKMNQLVLQRSAFLEDLLEVVYPTASIGSKFAQGSQFLGEKKNNLKIQYLVAEIFAK